MNLIGLAILLCACFLILLGSARRAWVGLIIGVLFIPQTQALQLGGLNVYALRFIEIVALARILIRGEWRFWEANRIDKCLVIFLVYTCVAYGLRTTDGLLYRLGAVVDGLLCFFVVRSLLRTIDDIRWALCALAVLLVPFAALVTYETFTGHNFFQIMGGRSGGGDLMRGSRSRACGPFRHPSLLGTVGVVFFPVYVGMLLEDRKNRQAAMGLFACAVIVLASNSGGPIGCFLVGLFGWMLWRARLQMRWFRWGFAVVFCVLAFSMKAPVWYLIARISSITGGDGFHRSRLMDQAFQNLGEWWLFGMPIERTQDWFAYYIHAIGGADLTNQFVLYGVHCGLLAVILFVTLIWFAFGGLGHILRHGKESPGVAMPNHYLVWGFGVALAVHVFNWIGITYFDQSYALWYAQLAMISTLTVAAGHSVSPAEEFIESESSDVTLDFPKHA